MRKSHSINFAMKICVNHFSVNRLHLLVYLPFTTPEDLSRNTTKPTKWLCAQRRLRSAWASAQSDQRLRCPHQESFGPFASHWAHSEDSDQPGRTAILLVLSCRGSFVLMFQKNSTTLKTSYRISNISGQPSYLLYVHTCNMYKWTTLYFVRRIKRLLR